MKRKTKMKEQSNIYVEQACVVFVEKTSKQQHINEESYYKQA